MYPCVVKLFSDVMFHGVGFMLRQTHQRPSDEYGADELQGYIIAEEEADLSMVPVFSPRPNGQFMIQAVNVGESNAFQDLGQHGGDL